MIFKGKEENKIEKDLSKLNEIKNKKIYAICQPKVWCDANIFLKLYYNIFLNYEQRIIKKKCLLIIDKSPSHYNHKVLEEFKKNDTYFITWRSYKITSTL